MLKTYHTNVPPRLIWNDSALNAFYANQVSRDLGSLFPFLPEGSMSHDHKAYLRSEERPLAVARHPELATI